MNNCYYRGHCPFIKSQHQMYSLVNRGQNHFMEYDHMEDFQYSMNEENREPIITFQAVDLRELQE